MDPLSVTASVVGLIGAAAKIWNVIEFISSAKTAPANLRDAQSEVKHVEMVLQSLQRYLLHLEQIDPKRRKCMQLDQVVIALTDAMLVFSKFEALLAVLEELTQLQAVIMWFKYSKQIDDYILKLQRNKHTLVFMLNILQCESDLEASQSQQRLQESIEQILAENNDLRQRLGQLQDAFDAHSRMTSVHSETRKIRPYSYRSQGNGTSSSTEAHRSIMIAKRAQSCLLSATFESELEASWVYQRNRDGDCDISFKHSDLRSHAWSYLTGHSLADISTLSVISMPLTHIDITNSTYYSFGVAGSHESDTASRLDEIVAEDSEMGGDMYPVLPDTPRILPQLSDCYMTPLELPDPYMTTPELPGSHMTPLELPDAYITSPELLDSHMSPRGLPDSYMTPLELLDLPTISRGRFNVFQAQSALFVSPFARADGTNPEVTTEPVAKLSDSTKGFFTDHRDGCAPCRGCGYTVQKGKAFEFAGHRWHLDCLRCVCCHTLHSSESKFLVRRGGYVVCVGCYYNYNCSACHKMKRGMIVMPEGQAFCKGCFRCSMCKNTIQTHQFARSSQDLFCLDCLDVLKVRRHETTIQATPQRQQLEARSEERTDIEARIPIKIEDPSGSTPILYHNAGPFVVKFGDPPNTKTSGIRLLLRSSAQGIIRGNTRFPRGKTPRRKVFTVASRA